MSPQIFSASATSFSLARERESHAIAEAVISCDMATSRTAPAKLLFDRFFFLQVVLEKFLSPLVVLDYDLRAAQRYGELHALLENRGTRIGPLDQQIAAHALALNVTLVTNNLCEFKRVPDLQLENWV